MRRRVGIRVVGPSCALELDEQLAHGVDAALDQTAGLSAGQTGGAHQADGEPLLDGRIDRDRWLVKRSVATARPVPPANRVPAGAIGDAEQPDPG